MGLYETLVRAYDELFPPAPAARGFLGPPPSRGALAVDLGCATGAHAAMLAELGWSALGVDTSEAMIAAAAARYAGMPGLRLAEGAMLDIGGLAPPGAASLILCVGNTLPHLGRAELGVFFARSAAALGSGGRLVVQLLNYAKLLAERPAALPEISAGSWLFRRSYRYRDDGSVIFATELANANGGLEAERGETALTPFTVDEVTRAAANSGLTASGVYASWEREPFNPAASAVALIDLRRA